MISILDYNGVSPATQARRRYFKPSSSRVENPDDTKMRVRQHAEEVRARVAAGLESPRVTAFVNQLNHQMKGT